MVRRPEGPSRTMAASAVFLSRGKCAIFLSFRRSPRWDPIAGVACLETQACLRAARCHPGNAAGIVRIAESACAWNDPVSAWRHFAPQCARDDEIMFYWDGTVTSDIPGSSSQASCTRSRYPTPVSVNICAGTSGLASIFWRSWRT